MLNTFKEKIVPQTKETKPNDHCSFSSFILRKIIVYLLCAGCVLSTEQTVDYFKSLCAHGSLPGVGEKHKQTNNTISANT